MNTDILMYMYVDRRTSQNFDFRKTGDFLKNVVVFEVNTPWAALK